MKHILIAILIASSCSTAFADVRLAAIFNDHMVVQRNQPIPVWGWGESGESVTVALGGHTQTTTTDADGRWMISLNALTAGGPHELNVSGKNTLTVSDVLVGEVWFCSGQSNMAMTVARALDFEQEKTLANHPKIRMFKTAPNSRPQLQNDCTGAWTIASAETVGQFSATAWFFGRKLRKELNVPIGLINSSWGGTDIAAWTSGDIQQSNEVLAKKMATFDDRAKDYSPQKADEHYKAELKKWEAQKAAGDKVGRKPRLAGDPLRNQNRPSNLYNGMVHPLIPYGIRGAIWYQGEHNSGSITSGLLYATQLKMMITDWRTRWNQGDFPFITVQLPNFRAKQTHPVETSGWVMVRESMLKSLSMKNTGLAVTTDVGMTNDIHPKNKQAVGLRLALWALGTTYKKDITYSGPIYSFHQYRGASSDTKPGRIEIIFQNIGDELRTTDGKPVQGFALAGEDKVFHSAKAQIVGGTMLNVSSNKVMNPVALRYNWAANPIGNLENSVGLPASPFRTDTWNDK